MTDKLPTIWNAEPHTIVKHAILRRYLDAWFPILTQQAEILRQRSGNLHSREILFIDGFAGPGEYKNGEPGSPVIALKSAIDHKFPFPMPVRLLFIESRQDRFNHLQRVITPHLKVTNASNNIRAAEPRQGDCDAVLNKMLDEYGGQVKFGPALAFLDQFGYGAVSMDLIARILSYPQCEVFTYLNYKEMNRWITDENKADAFTRAFGNDSWRECVNLPERQRRERLLENYKIALRERAGANYVVSFLMFDQKNLPLYWLLFCTNNLRGLEEMKKAMWHVDKTGEFRFSDRENPDQLDLLEKSFDPSWLAGELRRKLAGRTMTAYEIKEHVLTETPCYLFKGSLKSLELNKDVNIVNAPVGRKTGAFLDNQLDQIRVRFEVRSLF